MFSKNLYPEVAEISLAMQFYEMEKLIAKRKSYPVSLKLEAIAMAKKNTKEQAARYFGVNSKRIREWCRSEDNLRKLHETKVKQISSENRPYNNALDLTVPKTDNYVSKRKSYTVTFKLEAVEMAKKYSKERVARIFGVDSKRIREWCKSEDELRKLNNLVNTDKRRLDGGGRHCMSHKLESKLLGWIEEQRANDVEVTRKIVAQKAVEIFKTDNEVRSEAGQADFSGSNGWVIRFLQRNNITLTSKRKTDVQ